MKRRYLVLMEVEWEDADALPTDDAVQSVLTCSTAYEALGDGLGGEVTLTCIYTLPEDKG